jgi:hypothetical protein
MNVYARIRNILFAKKTLKDISTLDDRSRNLNVMVFSAYRGFKKNGYERNLMAKMLRVIREKYPYELKGWANYKNKYDEYFNMEGSIKSMSEAIEKFNEFGFLYVTNFRNETYYQVDNNPYKYTVMSRALKKGNRVFKMVLLDNKGRVLTNDMDDWAELSEDWLTAFRYSTEDEIEKCKFKIDNINSIDDKIDEKYSEIDILRKEQRKFKE